MSQRGITSRTWGIQTKFVVTSKSGRERREKSIIDERPDAPWVGDGGWDAWCKRMAEKESRVVERTRAFIEGGLKHGVYRIEGGRVVVTDGNVKKSCFCMVHGDVGHAGELYWKAREGYDWVRNELTEPESEVKKLLEDWLTDNWFNYLKNAA